MLILSLFSSTECDKKGCIYIMQELNHCSTLVDRCTPQVLVADVLTEKAQQLADSLGSGTSVASLDDVNAGALLHPSNVHCRSLAGELLGYCMQRCVCKVENGVCIWQCKLGCACRPAASRHSGQRESHWHVSEGW